MISTLPPGLVNGGVAFTEITFRISLRGVNRPVVEWLISGAPSLRFLSEMSDGALRGLESQWHKVYIGWHSILGQLKVKQKSEATKAFWGSKK